MDIVVCTDFSPNSKKAFRQALSLSKCTKQRVVHVLTVSSTRVEANDNRLDGYIEMGLEAGCQVLPIVLEGQFPSQVIIQKVDEMMEDGKQVIVVVGSRGISGAASKFLLGSVSDNLVQCCNAHVMVVK